MLSITIKEEPVFKEEFWEDIEWSNIDCTLTSQSQIGILSQIKLEPSDYEMTTESLIDNSDLSSVNIYLKQESYTPDDEDLNRSILDKYESEHSYYETDRINMTWPSEKNHIYSDLKYFPESEKNDMVLKNARVVLERIPSGENSHFNNIFETDNTHRNGRKKGPDLTPFIKSYCPVCDKAADPPTNFYTPVICGTCKNKTSLQCKKCNRVYSKPNSMHYHLRSKCYIQKIYECKECDYKTRMWGLLRQHMGRKHTKIDENVECPKCSKKFTNRYSLMDHKKCCNKAARYYCTICPYKSPFKTMLKRHAKSHEKLKTLVEQVATTANISVNYIDDGDVRPWISDNNNRMNFNNYEYLNHFKRFCPVCDETYENDSIGKSSHCHVCKSKLLMQCLKCNSRLKNRKLMNNHLRKCVLKAYYKCPICDQQTLYEHNLRRHIRKMHKNSDDDNKVATSRVDDSYPYNCDHCSFRTKHRDSIIAHVQTHSTTRPIKKFIGSGYYHKAYCSKCDAFKQVVQHSNAICNICKNLVVFKCKECGVELPTRKDMRAHESENHGYVYHECRSCDKVFLRLRSFEKHREVCQDGK